MRSAFWGIQSEALTHQASKKCKPGYKNEVNTRLSCPVLTDRKSQSVVNIYELRRKTVGGKPIRERC